VDPCHSPRPPHARSSGYFHPNPFSSQLQATFEVAEAGEVRLSILDYSGKEILSVIENEFYSSGEISVSIDGSGWEKGVYYYVFTAGQERKVGRLICL